MFQAEQQFVNISYWYLRLLYTYKSDLFLDAIRIYHLIGGAEQAMINLCRAKCAFCFYLFGLCLFWLRFLRLLYLFELLLAKVKTWCVFGRAFVSHTQLFIMSTFIFCLRFIILGISLRKSKMAVTFYRLQRDMKTPEKL
jgi:hypothetical protein